MSEKKSVHSTQPTPSYDEKKLRRNCPRWPGNHNVHYTWNFVSFRIAGDGFPDEHFPLMMDLSNLINLDRPSSFVQYFVILGVLLLHV